MVLASRSFVIYSFLLFSLMIVTFESRKNSFPTYFVLIACCLVAFIFKDRFQYLIGSGLALIMFLGCYGIGKRVCFSILKMNDQSLFFGLGLGILLAATYVAGLFLLDRKLLYIIWGTLAGFAAFEVPILTYRLNRSGLWAAPLILIAFWSAFTPATFPDALKSEIGLANQYLVLGTIQVNPTNILSTFPPFGPVLHVLYSGFQNLSGVRVFSLLVFLEIISCLIALLKWLITEPVFASEDGTSGMHQTELLYLSKSELMFIPLLYFPAAYVLIHLGTSELIASLFFCCALSYVMKEFESLSVRKLFHVGLFLAFGLWTRFSLLAYILVLPVLWYALNGWRWNRGFWKEIGLLWGIVLFCWLPIMLRNGLLFGDPLYPALAGILHTGTWTAGQSVSFVRDFMSGGRGGVVELLITPLALTFQPEGFGPASQIGIVFLVSLCIFPFARKLKTVNRMLAYCTLCFLVWFFLFADFRNLLPVFFFMLLIAYFAFRFIFVKASRFLRWIWIAGLLSCLVYLYPVSRRYPLILPAESQNEYLRNHLDYFSLAETVNRFSGNEPVYLLGEDRIGYFQKRLIVSSIYDQDPVLNELKQVQTTEQIDSRFRGRGIRHIILNEHQFLQKHGDKGSVPLPDSSKALLQEFFQTHAIVLQKSGDLILYELKSS